MTESVHVLISRIERIEKELEELKQELLKLKAEKEEAEIIPEQEYQELKKGLNALKITPRKD
ncbi:hypothetical protein [Thermococcus sp.]|uniref:hypothetical protein n=1 Tax=Thermococcus sp. TaxID=35749 RepID=UPI00261084B4|nr:hypothetical protein [Thermococcus sp.]